MTDRSFRLAAALAVAALAIVAWAPTLSNGFLNYDDPQMIVGNPRLADPGADDVVAAFRETREFAYLPLYVLALMPEASVFGLDPAGFHLGSILWHAVGAVLVLAFAHALSRSRTAAFVAGAVFAVHPMASESVAWASGRKDQVSLVLLLLALAAALGHLRRGGWGRIALAALCAALALFAKGSAVVFPLLAALLVLFTRADGSLHPRARPLALVGVAAAVAAAAAWLHLRIAVDAGTAGGGIASPWDRFRVFLEALWGYVSHLVVPTKLSIHYEPSGADVGAQVLGALVLLACLAHVVVLWLRPRKPGQRIHSLAACWFLAAILPFNGVFPQTSVAMADRYAFTALPAFGLAVGALLAAIPAWPRVIAAVAALALLVPLARARAAEFRDSETVFRAALSVDPGDSLAALKLAEALREKPPVSRNRAEAIGLVQAAAARARGPVREARARLLLADTLLQAGRFEESVKEGDRLLALEREHERALRALGFDGASVRFNRAAALLGAGRRADAISALDAVLERESGHRQARLLRAGLGAQEAYVALAGGLEGTPRDRGREDVNRSLDAYERVIAELVAEQSRGAAGPEVVDQEIQARTDLVRLLVRADWRPDRLNAALMQADALVRRHPARAEGYVARAQIVRDVDPNAAAADLRAAANLGSRRIPVLRALAGALLSVGKNREAIAVLESARALDPGDPGPVGDLRGVYVAAARGHLENPEQGPDLKRARGALELAQALGRDEPEVLDTEASLLEAEGRHDDAGAAWERLRALAPAHQKGRLGVARARQRRGLAILADLRALTETAPAAGRKARREELLAEVAADFKTAAECAPDDEEIAFARGWLKSRLREGTIDPILAGARVAAERGDVAGATRLLEQAAGIDATYVAVAEMQGHVAMQKGDDAAALAAFTRTVALDPDNLAANDALARLHLKRGAGEEAVKFARKFLALALKMQDATPTLREEVELMERLVLSLESRPKTESAPESRR
jgi:protein O-mannosyl-transferase